MTLLFMVCLTWSCIRSVGSFKVYSWMQFVCALSHGRHPLSGGAKMPVLIGSGGSVCLCSVYRVCVGVSVGTCVGVV